MFEALREHLNESKVSSVCTYVTVNTFSIVLLLLSNVQNMSSSVLSGFKTTRRCRVVLDPIKHVPRVF